MRGCSTLPGRPRSGLSRQERRWAATRSVASARCRRRGRRAARHAPRGARGHRRHRLCRSSATFMPETDSKPTHKPREAHNERTGIEFGIRARCAERQDRLGGRVLARGDVGRFLRDRLFSWKVTPPRGGSSMRLGTPMGLKTSLRQIFGGPRCPIVRGERKTWCGIAGPHSSCSRTPPLRATTKGYDSYPLSCLSRDHCRPPLLLGTSGHGAFW